MPPGFVPAACNQMNISRTREVWEAPEQGSGKVRQADTRQGRLEGDPEVLLADSTQR